MTILARGRLARVFVALSEPERRSGLIARILLRLDDATWVELVDASNGSDNFVLPEPLGCECQVSDISDRGWSGRHYELSFAASYTGDGTLWAGGCALLTKDEALAAMQGLMQSPATAPQKGL